MTEKDILVEKFNLLGSVEYQKIKSYQIENILRLANSDIEPLVLKGMLKNIADTDKWESEFWAEKRKLKKE